MKKTFTKTLIASVMTATMFISCTSTKNTTIVQSDSYSGTEISDSNNSTGENTTSSKTEKSIPTKKKFSEKKSYEKNELEKFFTFGNKDDYIVIDQTSIFSLTMFSSIKQQVCDVYISTKNENEAGFGATIMSNYYIFMMDKENRTKLRMAFESYLNDFENKKLDRKSKKTFKKYGNINVTAHWGPIKNTTPSYGTGSVNLGYEFEKNSPYFCFSMYPIFNEYYNLVGDTTSTESMNVKYYFTKSQMKDLLNALSEDNITTYYNEYFNKIIIEPATSDDYYDSEE